MSVIIRIMETRYHFYFKNEVRPLTSITLHKIASFECSPGDVLPQVKADSFALYLVSKGRGIYTVMETEYKVIEGCLFAMYPGTEIKCQSDTEEPWSLITVNFSGADARLLLSAAGFQPKAPLRFLDKKTAELVVNIYAAMSSFSRQSIYGTVQNTAFLYTLIATLAKSSSWVHADTPPGWTGVIHFQKAIKYISENFYKPITVNDIASHVGLTYNRLYRIFLEQNFVPPQQYLTEFRIREGCSLLEKRAGSIKEIAYAVGIEDPLYFSKLFKQHIGLSPTNYMKKIIKKEKGGIRK